MTDSSRRTRSKIIAGLFAILVLAGVGAIAWKTLRASSKLEAARADVPAAAATPAAPATVPPVYIADLEKATVAPPEFSAGKLLKTRTGGRPYIGRFGESGVVFTLSHLPTHKMVRVVFDLALVNSWNGSSKYWGPDILSCRVTDGAELLRATFCNCGFFSNNNEQTYPDSFPTPAGAAPYPAWTGAAERQTLGEIRNFGNANPPVTEDCSSVYHMDWIFPHATDQLQLNFASSLKDKKMAFGFLSFRAEALAEAPDISEADLKSAWADLIGDNPVAANAAEWRFIAAGNHGVDFLEGRQLTPPAPTTNPILQLLESNEPSIASSSRAQRTSRVRHILEVIGTAEASELRLLLPEAK